MTALLTNREIDHARMLARMRQDESEDLAPARGIFMMTLIGSAVWAVIAIILYFIIS